MADDDTSMGKSLPAPSDKACNVPSIDVLSPTFIKAGYVFAGVVFIKGVPMLVTSLIHVLPFFYEYTVDKMIIVKASLTLVPVAKPPFAAVIL